MAVSVKLTPARMASFEGGIKFSSRCFGGRKNWVPLDWAGRLTSGTGLCKLARRKMLHPAAL
jgi:hypothetical protein